MNESVHILHINIVFHVENSSGENGFMSHVQLLNVTVSICPRRSALIVLQAFHVIVEKVTEGRR